MIIRIEKRHGHASGSSKNHLRPFFLAVFLVLTIGSFRFFPGIGYLKELWISALFLFLTIPYLYWKARCNWRFTKYELYVLAMMLIVPVVSAFAAWREFGQPFAYGFLAQRNIFLGTGALALIYVFRHGKLTIANLEKALLLLVWLTPLIYLVITAFLEPIQFEGVPGFVKGSNPEQMKFNFDNTFIIFGFFYYAFAGFRRKSKTYFLLATVLFAYLVIVAGGRSMLVAVTGSLAVFLYRWGSFTRLVLLVPKIAAISFLLLGSIYLANPLELTSRLNRFSDAFTVVLLGVETDDISANARLNEFALILPYLKKHRFIGNGDISNQWDGGYERVLGGYFHPSDIGIVGVLYMYGIFGVMLFAWQFLFAWSYIKRLRRRRNRALVDAITGFLLYFAIHSIVTARFAHYSEIGFIFIAVLWCIVLERKGVETTTPRRKEMAQVR